MGEAYWKSSQTYFLLPSVSSLPTCICSSSLPLRSAVSSPLCPPRCAALIPQLLSPLMFTVTACTRSFSLFSASLTTSVSVCVWGRRAAAVSPPLPSKTIVAAVWGGESGRFTHSWRCHQQPRSCLSLTRAQGCTHMQTPPLPFPFKTVLPEKLSIIPSPQWAVFPIHCSDQLNPVDDICSLPPGSSRAYFVCGCDGKAVPALYLKMQMCIY